VPVGKAGRIIGSVMVGHDGHRGWAPLHRGPMCEATESGGRWSSSAEWLRQRAVVKVNFWCGRRTPRWLAFMRLDLNLRLVSLSNG